MFFNNSIKASALNLNFLYFYDFILKFCLFNNQNLELKQNNNMKQI
jgi:hypothetical protein